MTDHEKLVKLLLRQSVKRGQFTLASGKTSDIYIDVRMTSMHPEGLALIGSLGLEQIKSAGWMVDAIGGLTLGADPVAYAISQASFYSPPAIRAFTVRKDAKTHGTTKLIEGPLEAGDHVAVVEDVITTGGSAMRAIEAIENFGGSISGVLAVVDREEGGVEQIESKGYQVIALTRVSELMAVS